MKEQTSMGDSVTGVCYRPLDQKEQVDEALYRQIGAASRSQALFSWRTLITLISTEGTTQHGISNPRGSWRALMTTASPTW